MEEQETYYPFEGGIELIRTPQIPRYEIRDPKIEKTESDNPPPKLELKVK